MSEEAEMSEKETGTPRTNRIADRFRNDEMEHPHALAFSELCRTLERETIILKAKLAEANKRISKASELLLKSAEPFDSACSILGNTKTRTNKLSIIVNCRSKREVSLVEKAVIQALLVARDRRTCPDSDGGMS